MSSCNMASEDHLGQREDGDLVLRVVGQVLVQVGQAGRVAAQLVIHHPQLVPRSALPAGPPHQKARVHQMAPLNISRAIPQLQHGTRT